MRVPDNTLYPSRIRTYGTLGLEMPDIEDQPGCPRLYRAKYEEFRVKEPASEFTAYGTIIHDALFRAEEHGTPLLPDALDEAWASQPEDLLLGPSFYEEAVRDLEHYLERGGPEYATLAVEQHLTAPLMEIDGQQYWAGGYIDKVSVDPMDPRTIIIDDYKTNRAPVSQADVDRNNQLTHYAWIVRENLPRYMPNVDPADVRIVVAWDGIKWYRLESEREHWRLDQYGDWMRAVLRRIVADTEGAPVLNDGCSSCPVRFDCEVFRKLPGEGSTLVDRMSTMTDLTQRVYLMQQAQLVAKALDKGVIEPVKAELLAEAKRRGEPVVVNGVAYVADTAWRTDVDMAEVMAILGEDRFLSIASVTQAALKEVAKNDPVLKDKLDGAMQRVPTEKFQLKVKKAE